MNLETWAAFAAAAAIVLAIPGPTVLVVAAYALSAGRRVAFAVVAGVALGDLVAMTASVAGLGALMATSATLFTVLKWIGAAYLIWLGLTLWRSAETAGDLAAGEPAAVSARAAFGRAFAVTATNPKSIAFFVAFLPQFVDPSAPAAPQLALMVATFVTLAAVNAALYGLLAERMRSRLSGPRAARIVARTGGGLLMALGAAAALAKRA